MSRCRGQLAHSVSLLWSLIQGRVAIVCVVSVFLSDTEESHDLSWVLRDRFSGGFSCAMRELRA
jgi:hypothetical protein